MITELLAAFGLNKASAMTGAIGAGVAALRGDPRPGWQRVLNFVVGFCVAAWGSGVSLSAFNLPDNATYHGALGFTLGYLGMTIMDAVLLATEAFKSLDFKNLAESWIKRRGGP